MDNNTCVMCGDIIPEGRYVCPNCENKVMNSEINHNNMRIKGNNTKRVVSLLSNIVHNYWKGVCCKR